jgi:predicted Zn-dependent protease
MAMTAVKDGQLQLTASHWLSVRRDDLVLVGLTMVTQLRKLPDSPKVEGFPDAMAEAKFTLRSVRVAALDDTVDQAQLISVCERLKGVIRVPISVDLRSDISLSRLGRSEAQLDGDQVIAQLRDVNHAAEGEAFFGVTSRDLAARGLNFVFSSTDPLGYSVISTYRMKGDPGGERLEKQFKKQMARLAGLNSRCGLMGTPLSVGQLDAMPADYCAQDKPALKKLDFLRDSGR